MKCYCIANTETKTFLSIDDTWVSFEDGIKNDSIRGYTGETECMISLEEDVKKFGGEARLHPSPEGETKPLFYEWGS